MNAFAPANPDFAATSRTSLARQAVMSRFGIEMTAIGAGTYELTMAWRADLTQQNDYIHGGIVSTLADSAADYACHTLVAASVDVLTVEYKINFLALAAGPPLIARGTVIRVGRTLLVGHADVYASAGDGSGDGAGESICVTLTETIMTRPG